MDTNEIESEIFEIMDTFGMSGIKAAETMNISYQVFKNKKNPNAFGHTFNEKNLRDMKIFIGKQMDKVVLKTELTNFCIFLEVPELNSVSKIEEKADKWLNLRNQIF